MDSCPCAPHCHLTILLKLPYDKTNCCIKDTPQDPTVNHTLLLKTTVALELAEFVGSLSPPAARVFCPPSWHVSPEPIFLGRTCSDIPHVSVYSQIEDVVPSADADTISKAANMNAQQMVATWKAKSPNI
ncbi:hypothetical protein AJ80_07698 [Polytolypa hystricis UAMH7299]|uniref:Uncharacterized protein n=1 Tax=Polytolypa hystricis (strain UAMH7299) TaxID=1447883 RepID=A0A2B7XKW6_POLH7|nr:hypothetical protein AJ80_07698 [Polytolypa hystricis UAMH7299]